MNRMILTTTNTIEGNAIKKYFKPITANVVIGANIFSDIAASFTDFFGGRSSSYEKKLEQMFNHVSANLIEKAEMLGANCIVGLKLDVDEISGKNNQMFMVTAYGTPVIISQIDNLATDVSATYSFEGSYIDNKVFAKRILNLKLGDINKFSSAHINLMLETKFPEFIPYAFEGIADFTNEQLKVGMLSDEITNKMKSLKVFLATTDRRVLTQAIYKEFSTANNELYFNHLIDVVVSNGIINYDRIKQLIESKELSEAKIGLILLNAEKPEYTQADILQMKEFVEVLKSRFIPRGQIVNKKKLLSSAEKEVWNCECGKTNEMESKYCLSCGCDIYGFKKEQIAHERVIKLLQDRVTILEELYA